MKLYDFGQAPNPRRVRIFLAEKGIKVPTEQMDIGTLQHRNERFAALNPMQRLPALVLDDGTAIAESMAICRYFEALYPDPPLFGRGPLDSALVEMWNRRAEFHLLAPVATVFQHLHPYMKRMVDPRCRRGARRTSRGSLSFCNSSTASSAVGPISRASNSPSPTSPRWRRWIS